MTEEEQAERRPQVEELQDVLRQALREDAVEWEEAAEFAQGVLELSAMVGAREPAWLKAVAVGEEPSLDLPGEEEQPGANERAGEWPGDELDPRPYEMSRHEWRNARHGERPNYAHQGLTRRSGAEEVARVAKFKELGFGVKKPIDPELEGRPPVRHRDLVELALRLGRDVPADVLDQHPDLKERRRELGREGVTVNIVDPGQTVKRREVAEAERRGLTIEPPDLPEPDHFSNIGRYTKDEFSDARTALMQETPAWNRLRDRLHTLEQKIKNGDLEGRDIDGGFGEVSPLSAWYELRDGVWRAIKRKKEGGKEARRPEALREVWEETMLPALRQGHAYADIIETDWLFEETADPQEVVDEILKRELGSLKRGLIKKILSRHHDVMFRGQRERGNMLSPWGLYEIIAGRKTVGDYREAEREREAERAERRTESLRRALDDLDVIHAAFREYVEEGYSTDHLPTLTQYLGKISGGQVEIERRAPTMSGGEAFVKRVTEERPRGGRRFSAVREGTKASLESLFYVIGYLKREVESEGREELLDADSSDAAFRKIKNAAEKKAKKAAEAGEDLAALYELGDVGDSEEDGAPADQEEGGRAWPKDKDYEKIKDYPLYLSPSGVVEMSKADDLTLAQRIEYASLRWNLLQENLDTARNRSPEQFGVAWANKAAKKRNTKRVKEKLKLRGQLEEWAADQLPKFDGPARLEYSDAALRRMMETGEVPEPKTVQPEEEREGSEEDKTRRMADVDAPRSLSQGNNVEGRHSTTGYEHLPYDTLEDWVRVFDAIKHKAQTLSKGARPRLRRHMEELPEEVIERATDTGVLKGAKSRVERLKPPRGKRKGDVTTELINDLHNRRQALENQEREGSEEDAAPSEWGQDVIEIPIEELRTDEERFQPRGGDYSEETARRVAENFDPNLFEPIRAWQDPDEDGSWFVLAGHSRLEGMRRRDAETIPVRPFEGSEEEAIRFALTENDKGDQLTNAERATYIRRLRAQGATKKEQKQEAKRLYGRDASTVVALSYLDPEGKALDVLSAFEGNATGEANDAETMAVWIGKLRRYHPELTDSHESEIWSWLEGNYKTEGKGISSFIEFREIVEDYIDRRSMFGELDGPINFAEIQPKSQQEREIDRQLQEARQQLKKDERALKKQREEYAGQDLTEEEWSRVLGDYQESVRIAQERVLEMEQKAKEGRHHLAQSEMDLFDAMRENPADLPPKWSDVKQCAIATENEEAGGIELRFPSNPGEDVLEVVREAGFFFYTPAHQPAFWAAQDTDRRRALACALDKSGDFCTRENPSLGALVFIGKVERVETTAGVYAPKAGEEQDLMFTSAEGDMLLIVPERFCKEVPADAERGAAAAELFEEYHSYEAGATDYEIKIPEGPVVPAGTAQEIIYHSDKIKRPGDERGLMHQYVHEFDDRKRPAQFFGSALYIGNVDVTARGILN